MLPERTASPRPRRWPLKFPRLGLAACAWWLAAGVLVANFLALWPVLPQVPAQPGIDFQFYWGIAQTRPDLPPQQANPYRYLMQYNALLAQRVAASGDPLLVQAHALRPEFDLTNTPLVYALGALYPARYAPALRWHRGLSVLAFGLAVAALLPLTNGAALGTVVLTVLLAAGYWPFWLNLAVGNLAALQLAGLVVGIGLARRTRSSPTAGLLNVAWLTALVLIKPNIALPCALLWWFSLAHLPRVWRLPALAVSVACAAGLLTYAARFFASPAIWLDWLWVLFGAPNRLAYDYALGNVSSAHWLAQTTGLSVRVIGALFLALLAGAFGLQAYWRCQRAAPWVPVKVSEPHEWAAIGVVLTLASAPVVWPHYAVLAIIPLAWLARSGTRAWPKIAALLGLLAIATVPAVKWRWQLAPTTSGLRVIESLAWLPLALGLLGCSGAGLPMVRAASHED